MVTCPTLVLVSASNTLPDPDNVLAKALLDRITLMLHVEDVKADESFKEVFRRHHERRQADRAGGVTRETVTLEQVQEAQRTGRCDHLAPDFLDEAAEPAAQGAREGVGREPRRWMELGRVCRANAWMAGRDHLIAEDLVVTEHGMWRDPAHKALARSLVLDYHGRYEQAAEKKRLEAADHFAAIEKIRPTCESTPPTQKLPREVMDEGVDATRAIDFLKGEVDELLAEADREKRDASSLRDLANELLTAQEWLHENSFPTKYRP
jgi:MoxR-like ATPase